MAYFVPQPDGFNLIPDVESEDENDDECPGRSDEEVSLLSFFLTIYILSAALNLADRARKLAAISCSLGTRGFFVRIFKYGWVSLAVDKEAKERLMILSSKE